MLFEKISEIMESGKILLENIIKICKENNIEILKLEVNKNNNFAIKLYKSFGFKLVRN